MWLIRTCLINKQMWIQNIFNFANSNSNNTVILLLYTCCTMPKLFLCVTHIIIISTLSYPSHHIFTCYILVIPLHFLKHFPSVVYLPYYCTCSICHTPTTLLLYHSNCHSIVVSLSFISIYLSYSYDAILLPMIPLLYLSHLFYPSDYPST